MQTKQQAFEKLKRSRFRSSFHLSDKDIAYVKEKGMDTIRDHALDFIRKRLAPAEIKNDGRQTPWRGHPVFVAQHACAFCCRGCMQKWYNVKKDVRLTEDQQERIADFLMEWIALEIKGGIGNE